MFEMWRTGVLLMAWFSMAGADYYIATCPNQIRPGMTFDLELTFLQKHFTIDANVGIFRSDNPVVSKSEQIDSDVYTRTISMQIPFDATSGSYRLDISVERQGVNLLKNSTVLQFSTKSVSIFIQADKAMYRPGQLVQFRAFSVDPDLNVMNGDMDVGIFDPEGIKMAQWLEVPTTQGLFQNSMQLSDNPPLGNWKIEVDFKGQRESKIFEVAEYVLPRFGVTLQLPPFALSTDTYLTGTVRAKYTFGQGTKGTGLLTITRLYSTSSRKFTLNFDIKEEYKFKIDISSIANALAFGLPLLTTLNVVAEVEESLTEESMSDEGTITYYNYREKLKFASNFPNNFKAGLRFVGYLLLTDQADRPIIDTYQKVEVNITIYKYVSKADAENERLSEIHLPTKYLPVDNRGIIKLKLDLGRKVQKISITARYKQSSAARTLTRFLTKSGNSIQVELRTKTPKAGRKARFIVRSTVKNARITFMLISKGSVVFSDQYKMSGKWLEVRPVLTSAMAPSSICVVYTTRPDGEILADSIQFNVEGMFRNQVNLKFSRKKVKPGKRVSIVAKADPGSLVSMLSVDKSVRLLKTGNDVTPADVADELQEYVSNSVPVLSWCGGYRCYYPTSISGTDPQSVFQNSGLAVLTDALLFKYIPKRRYTSTSRIPDIWTIWSGTSQSVASASGKPTTIGQGTTSMVTPDSSKPDVKKEDEIRTIFPETWIYDNVEAGSKFRTKVPDTITSWITTGFALNNKTGLGMTAGPKTLTVFLDFFIDLRLPFSIIRGEQVLLQCNIFNFLQQDLLVTVTLMKSADFDNVFVKQDWPNRGDLFVESQTVIRDILVSASSPAAVYFPIIPKTLGFVDIHIDAVSDEASDTVIKQLLVEPEGVSQDYNVPVLIDLQETNSFQAIIPIIFPPTTVAGSERVRISVIGDLMGPTISGLDKLLRVPYGCGEQNMITLVPNIFVLKYLTAIDRLDLTKKAKAEQNMEQGYQRELTYRHLDGSFSAFGKRDRSGSTWLSAFVVKSFVQASPAIYIDPIGIRNTLDWLLRQFKTTTGLFREAGHVHQRNMMGGTATGGRNKASYVLIALLEAQKFGFKASNPNLLADVIVGAESSLEDAVDAGMTDTYQMAIGSYALALSESSKANTLLDKLDDYAIDEDGMRHWQEKSDVPVDEGDFKPPVRSGSSNSIEMTAYVLLTYAKVKDFNNGVKVVKWLVLQRNAYGGYQSTQDTVVALQAMATFAELIYSSTFDIRIETDVTPGSSAFPHTFFVNNDNSLVLQTVNAPGSTQAVEVSAYGNGVALLEVAVFYNVIKVPLRPFFEMDVSFTNENIQGFKLTVCFNWLGIDTSGMVVMEIAVLSGFRANRLSISQLETLMRVEDSQKGINLYFDEVDADKVCVSMKMHRDGLVVGSQPAPIRLYSYYDREKQVTTLYQPNLLANSNFCDIAGKELGCLEELK